MTGGTAPEPWESPRFALGSVAVVSGVCLLLRLWFFDLGFVVGFLALAVSAVFAFVALGMSLMAFWHRPTPASLAPLAVLGVAALLWFVAPWQHVYLRTVWVLHQRQYANIVHGLQTGALTAGRSGRVVDGAGTPVQPAAWANADDAGPLPNVYFILEGGTAFEWRPFGFLYTTNGNAGSRSDWPLGANPTELKPYWYVLSG